MARRWVVNYFRQCSLLIEAPEASLGPEVDESKRELKFVMASPT
jgi:hypothetical protein